MSLSGWARNSKVGGNVAGKVSGHVGGKVGHIRRRPA
jgi:hypothetical protein